MLGAPIEILDFAMKRALNLTVILLALAVSQEAAAQFVGESVSGSERLCVYRHGPTSDGQRVHRVRLGEACPAHFPSSRSNLPAPPTARLVASTIQDGARLCSYSQRNRRWNFRLRLDERCPVNAGSVAAVRDATARQQQSAR